jgi:hypothetical protein
VNNASKEPKTMVKMIPKIMYCAVICFGFNG